MPTSPIVVRRGVPEDAEALLDISLDAIATSAAEHYTPAQRAVWAARRTLAAHRRMIDDSILFVAEVSGRAVGFGNLVVADRLLDHLFVAPPAGGRGVARALVEAVHDAARRAGLDEVETHASWRAVPAFERLGYERVEVEWVELDGERLSRVRMVRRLGRE